MTKLDGQEETEVSTLFGWIAVA